MGCCDVSDWPLLDALLNTASRAAWVRPHHGGGVAMVFSQQSGMIVFADGTAYAARRLGRFLWNDPPTGVMPMLVMDKRLIVRQKRI